MTQALGSAETVLNIQNYGTDLITLLGNGSLGVGTITPNHLLEVNGSSSFLGRIYTGAVGDSTGTPGIATLNAVSGKSAIAAGAIIAQFIKYAIWLSKNPDFIRYILPLLYCKFIELSYSCTITNSNAAASSLVFITPLDIDSTLTTWKAVPAGGNFTVTGNGTATANWKFQWCVIN